MADFTIYLGNRNYSSWSLRGWLMVRQAGISCREEVIPLFERGYQEKVRRYSPSGRVPVLHHGSARIWDSLAIGEYLHELHPEAGLWPEGRNARRLARSVSAEMHAGFPALRQALPMNIRRSAPGAVAIDPEVREDINRITAIWRDSRHWIEENAADGDEGFLFGKQSIADAMYAPVATRFITYGIEVDADCRAWMDRMMALPAMREWVRDAGDEPQILEIYEV